MKKMFMGVRLRKLRAERGLSQAAFAQALGLSPSYVNQLEQNQRPVTEAVLLKMQRALGIDIQIVSGDEETRLVAGLRDALADAPEPISMPELREAASQMPALGRAVVALHRRNLQLQSQLETISLRLGDDRSDLPPPRAMPFDVVRDFFFKHQNYFDAMDRPAEAVAQEAGVRGTQLVDWLVQRLATRHGVKVDLQAPPSVGKRQFDPVRRSLRLSGAHGPTQQVFQLATQLALLEQSDEIDALIATSPLLQEDGAHKLARLGLANYFAGALLLPYGQILAEAERLRYDIDLLGQQFGVGFETVGHRLSTLRRPEAPGVPLFFVRVDRAGNISKRQSATHFHFSRVGGTCPLWNVYEAFAQPGRIMRQVARMPDGRSYLWIARTVTTQRGGFRAPQRLFSIGLGCDIRDASRLVYARGLDLGDPAAATPIGMGCKVCERNDCPQRAFPFAGRPLDVDENRSAFAPYAAPD